MDVAGNGSLRRSNSLIYNVCQEQGSHNPPQCLPGAPGPLLTPSLPCSVWVRTNPLSSQMPRKQSRACARTHTHTPLLGKSPHLALT